MTRREDYLKRIYTMARNGEVHGADLAEALKVKRPTVSIYLKQLAEAGDIIMDAHHCIHLTAQGLAVAQATANKHGMLFALLQDLGVSERVAAEDACALEHSISAETYCALKQLLEERQVKI